MAFGIAAGAGFQAWRQYPPNGPATASSLWLLMVVAVVLAYLGGRWRGRGGAHATATATATAEASAVAQQSVQVAVVVPGAGAGTARSAFGSGALPVWMDQDRRQITADELDGADLSDFFETVEDHAYESETYEHRD